MSKRQIWLRPDECELVHACLRFMQAKLDDGHASDAHQVAGKFTYRRIGELLPLFAPKPDGTTK